MKHLCTERPESCVQKDWTPVYTKVTPGYKKTRHVHVYFWVQKDWTFWYRKTEHQSWVQKDWIPEYRKNLQLYTEDTSVHRNTRLLCVQKDKTHIRTERTDTPVYKMTRLLCTERPNKSLYNYFQLFIL